MSIFEVVLRQSQLMSRKIHAVAVEKRVARTLRNNLPGPSETVDFVVFFAEGPAQSYQLEQWLAPFEALQRSGHGVCLVLMNALTAELVTRRTGLPVLLSRSMERIETALASWGTSGIFYVNNSQANFTMLRISGPAHVHLSHGESEKSSMVSNQLKAYDFAFIAGRAARTRILEGIPRFDPAKLVEIGRPQLDIPAACSPVHPPAGRTNVLYAPTWEGDGKSMAYSSITTVAARLVEAMLADGRFSVVFRPHPKTGTWSATARRELARIEKAIEAAAARDKDAGHRVEVAGDSSLSIMGSDIVVCDISAMAMDAIGLDRPLMLLHSTDTPMIRELDPEQALSLDEAAEDLLEGNGRDTLDTVARMAADGPSARQRSLRDEVFGDPALGRPTERFIAAAIAVTGADIQA
ncbi:CDP-glycerol glycerophosphotransferase family protein [Paeniglutamicibacter sulfureus]|uniref:CDP-glycerol glycerophosphotransferase family protein n=1 Tax=Paeniglutamicibacter sulfureus TaxID=43666 RepID=UPI0026658FDA|nr:CDP-glycerol glycerophosphotransferase family protein [Paeniglutamicibacter sulfureus]MDO2936037.1 CDP-glycerol glycerophosphotransferase family protein [Paeniglutamicibacter sulfureus]